MPAWFSVSVRVRKRSKKVGLNLARSNFNPPSVAFPGPVRSQGSGPATRSGGELAVAGKPQNFGISVIHSKVKLCPCPVRKWTKAVKSKVRTDPLLPQY